MMRGKGQGIMREPRVELYRRTNTTHASNFPCERIRVNVDYSRAVRFTGFYTYDSG